jgi:inorganic pyrophosphatase/exopolyphosphatase
VRLSDKELAEKLAKLAGLEVEKVYKAITSKSVEKELEFAATIEVFSTIRKKL